MAFSFCGWQTDGDGGEINICFSSFYPENIGFCKGTLSFRASFLGSFTLLMTQSALATRSAS